MISQRCDYSILPPSTPPPAEGDGTKLYASCLAFYDRTAPELAARHSALQGGRALTCLVLLSRLPYLCTAEQASQGPKRALTCTKQL